MELRIFCQRGSCDNMLRTESGLGCKEKDILYMHGWKKINNIIVCQQCLRDDRERSVFQQKKTA